MTQPVSYPKETRGENFFDNDVNAQRLLQRIAPGMLKEYAGHLQKFGAWVGGDLDKQAAYSDRYAPPILETHNKYGEKKSNVVFNPLYEECHQEAYRRGTIGLAFQEQNPAPHLLSFTMGYLLSQTDISIHCPVTMTGAVAYVLDKFAPKSARDEFLHELIRMDGETKSGGTWATELHGGSDVGATTTRAVKESDTIKLYGLKWFTSNANSGLALATARPEGAPEGSSGLGLYLVPSHLKDGSTNSYSIRRLKDKLGTKALATGEIDLEGASVIEIAPPPYGLKLMMEALGYSRIHNAVSGAGLQRRAFLEAASWATHRKASGKTIDKRPMVQDEIVHLMVRGEASTALAFEAAKSFDAALADETKRPWLRIATALAKYRTAEDAVQAAKKAVEVVGGNGITAEFVTARLYRDAIILAVWEGPANIQANELLRMVAGKHPGDALFAERIQKISASLPAEMATEKNYLDKSLKEASDAMAYIRSAPASGERFALKLMQHMSEVLSGALLCEEAAHDLALGDRRKMIIAGRYLEQAFGDRKLRIGPALDITQDLFKELISYSVIPPVSTAQTPLPPVTKPSQQPPEP
ncbi:MAG: acyl-CoA dehydrogenase family protein [Alphaproteobacteria bacterium]